MAEIGSRELRNNTRRLLERVDAGEDVTITVDGRPVAALVPVRRRPRWLAKDELLAMLDGRQADPGLRSDLRTLTPDTTEDLPLR
jgi:prevent-host-death family protein